MSRAEPSLSRWAVDRAGARRKDDAWLRATWKDPDSGVLVLAGDETLVTDTGGDVRLALVAPEQAPPGERFLLGSDDERAYWAVPGPLPAAPGARPATLRQVGAQLDDRDAGLFVHAVALAAWHERHPRCPRCGHSTRVVAAGAARHCDTDGSEHFPRVDPAVIMLVHDGAERCVLGRQQSWPPGRLSILAGFVEPGESAEQAVAREVGEEVGLAVTDLRYVASQPWPFPSSLMLGYTARATDPPVEGDLAADLEELAEARWFTREQVRAAVAAGDEGADGLRLPPSVSISWRILTDWAGLR